MEFQVHFDRIQKNNGALCRLFWKCSSSIVSDLMLVPLHIQDSIFVLFQSLTVDESRNIRNAILVILSSMAFFKCCQFIVACYIDRDRRFGDFSLFGWRRNEDDDEEDDDEKDEELSEKTQWRISNEVTSLIHAVISGLWAVYICISFKQHVFNTHFNNSLTQNLFWLTTGYLVVDFIDLLVHDFGKRVVELLFHHIVVIFAVVIATYTGIYKGSLVLGLLMELNSIFLHIRSICNLNNQDKKSVSFRIIAVANIITFVVFRIGVSIYLLYWMAGEVIEGTYLWAFIPFFIPTGSLCISNLVLFYRVLAADGFLGKARARPTIVKPSSPNKKLVPKKMVTVTFTEADVV